MPIKGIFPRNQGEVFNFRRHKSLRPLLNKEAKDINCSVSELLNIILAERYNEKKLLESFRRYKESFKYSFPNRKRKK